MPLTGLLITLKRGIYKFNNVLIEPTYSVTLIQIVEELQETAQADN